MCKEEKEKECCVHDRPVEECEECKKEEEKSTG